MFTFTVSAAILNSTAILAKNQRIKGASVFPFFGRSGQVKRLMVLLPDSDIALMVPFKSGLAKVSWTGAVRLSMSLAELTACDDFTREQLDDLYHYDPNWMLSQERFSTYWATNLIKQANCADEMEKNVREIRFSRDLSRIESVVMKSSFLNVFRNISPETVLEAMPATQTKMNNSPIAGNTGGWRIDPIWWESGFH
jgi:hypothetical protein